MWFLDLCRRAWETTGHRVLGAAFLSESLQQLERISRIKSYPFDKLHWAMAHKPRSLAKLSSQEMLPHQVVTHVHREMSQVQMNPDKVLVIYDAEHLNVHEIRHLLSALSCRGGKILLVEGAREHMTEPSSAFDVVSSHLERLNSRHSLSHYESFAQDFIEGLRIPHEQKNELHISGPEL